MSKKTKIIIVLALITLWAASSFFSQDYQEVNYYPEFLSYIEEGQIESVNLIGNRIQAKLVDQNIIRTQKPSDAELTQLLMDKEIPFSVSSEPATASYISVFTSLIILVIIWRLVKTMKGRTSLNYDSKPEEKKDNLSHITFDHVAGIEEEKYELEEIVDFLKNPDKFLNIGARVPRGVLLSGPSGTGKTLLAKAVAGEAQVPFFSTSGSSFAEMFVGVGPSRVRNLFKKAKENAPCIVFIDEIDALGKKRGSSSNNEERENTLNQLLVELDGFESSQGVIVIGATNRPDVLDPALLRPGRFDRQIFVGPPDVKGRESILEVHAKGKPLDEDVDLKILAKQTPGFTGADLENLINEGALLALRENKETIQMTDLEEAIERVIAGTEKPSKVISDKDKQIVAFHEAGHALVGYLLKDKVHKISIIPRGQAGGYTMFLPEETDYVSKSQLLNKVKTLLAGRAAEEIIFDEITTGAQNDLERSSNIVKSMITRFGMNSFGPISFHDENMFKQTFSERTAQLIDKEIHDTINSCFEEAKDLLINNRNKLDKLAKNLVEKEVLDASQIDEILGG